MKVIRNILVLMILLTGLTVLAVPAVGPSGNFYDVVLDGSLTWDAAAAAASEYEFDGCASTETYISYLAVVTEVGEQAFLNGTFGPMDGLWLGGSQADGELTPAAGWEWHNGELWGFTNWDALAVPAEPNDNVLTLDVEDDEEQYLGTTTSGFWGDFANDAAMNGYVVEIECIPNEAPDAVEDFYGEADGAIEDTALVASVLDNDTDADGDPLTITEVTAAGFGSAVDNGDGTITYTPNANYCGLDSFDYTITDGKGGFDTATVSLDIACVNDLPTLDGLAASVTVNEGDIATNSGTVEDVDGDELTITVDLGAVDPTSFASTGINNGTAPSGGSLSWSYQSVDDFDDLVTITVDDNAGGVLIATFNLTVLNVAPTVDLGDYVRVAIADAVAQGINIQGTFFDPGVADTHVAFINVGNGWWQSAVGSFGGDGNGTVSTGSFTLRPPLDDYYNIEICVEDDDGGRGCDTIVVDVMPGPPSSPGNSGDHSNGNGPPSDWDAQNPGNSGDHSNGNGPANNPGNSNGNSQGHGNPHQSLDPIDPDEPTGGPEGDVPTEAPEDTSAPGKSGESHGKSDDAKGHNK